MPGTRSVADEGVLTADIIRNQLKEQEKKAAAAKLAAGAFAQIAIYGARTGGRYCRWMRWEAAWQREGGARQPHSVVCMHACGHACMRACVHACACVRA